jgi:hypothetical protein
MTSESLIFYPPLDLDRIHIIVCLRLGHLTLIGGAAICLLITPLIPSPALLTRLLSDLAALIPASHSPLQSHTFVARLAQRLTALLPRVAG